MPLIIVATIVPLPAHRDEVLAALTTAVQDVHTEDGCELYALHQNADRLVMIERWSDPGGFRAHGRSPALALLTAALDGLLEGPLDVVVLEPVPAGDPAKGQLRP